MFLVNSRQGYFRCGPNFTPGQALSLTYGRFFAEFLNHDSLVPLGLLALSTSVGLRYGDLALVLARFSRRALRLRLPRKTGTFRLRTVLRPHANDAKPIRHEILFPPSRGYDHTVGLEY